MVVLAALILSLLDIISVAVFDITFGLAMATMSLAFLQKVGSSTRSAFGITIALIGTVIIAWMTIPNVKFTPYLAIALANAAVAYMFLRGQLPDRTPLIVQMIELIDMAPVGSPSFRRYVYWQCWAWVCFGTVTAGVAVAAIGTASFRADASVAITALVIAQVAWFFASHGFANWHHRRPETCWDTIRVMSRRASWEALQV